MDTSDTIQSEMVAELTRIQKTFEDHYVENIDTTITKDAQEYRKRVERLGFTQNKIIHQHNKIAKTQEALEKFKDISLAIKFYREKYPIYKVIPLTLMIKIAEKYNLFFSKNENYIGDIPLKNVKELERFVEYAKGYEVYVPAVRTNNILDIKSETYSSIEANYSDYRHAAPYNNREIDFYITAPRNQFRTHDNLVTVGQYLIEKQNIAQKTFDAIYAELKRPKDPIVWIPVEFPMPGGACMIISKWGEEANYPEFTNPIEN